MTAIEDRNAILEVIAQYSYTYDSRDAAGFAALFTEDAVWEFYLADQADPEIRLQSRQEIRDWAQPRLEARQGKFSSRHHQSGTVFDTLLPDAAETRTMVLVTHHEVDQPHPHPTISGVYHDTWRKTEQGWKFAKRVLLTDKTSP